MKTWLTLNEVRKKLGNRSRSAIYLDMEAGRLPQPLRLVGRLYWDEAALDAHLQDLLHVADHSK